MAEAAGATAPLRAGPIDVHAHLLSEDCYEIPTRDGTALLEEVDGRLVLDGFPVEITREQLSSPQAALADMDRAGLAVRTIAAPPYAFAPEAPGPAGAAYATAVNDGIARACEVAPDRLLGLGVVALGDTGLARREIERLAGMPAMVGITIPPVVPAGSFECDPLRSIVRDALAHDLPVLVHPMQQCAPGLQHHYLRNLVGNPVESAVGIASLLLTGLAEELAGIRIGFVHGAGCAPLLLGRWDHGWRARADVRSDASRLPSELFREHVYLDLLTHDAPTAAFVASKAGADRVFLGSDYPWDMGDGDPIAAALAAGADLDRLTVNAETFLGLGSSR